MLSIHLLKSARRLHHSSSRRLHGALLPLLATQTSLETIALLDIVMFRILHLPFDILTTRHPSAGWSQAPSASSPFSPRKYFLMLGFLRSTELPQAFLRYREETDSRAAPVAFRGPLLRNAVQMYVASWPIPQLPVQNVPSRSRVIRIVPTCLPLPDRLTCYRTRLRFQASMVQLAGLKRRKRSKASTSCVGIWALEALTSLISVMQGRCENRFPPAPRIRCSCSGWEGGSYLFRSSHYLLIKSHVRSTLILYLWFGDCT